MLDVAESKGSSFDYDLLAKLMGMPVVPVIGTKNMGFDLLLTAVVQTLEGHSPFSQRMPRYDRDIETGNFRN